MGAWYLPVVRALGGKLRRGTFRQGGFATPFSCVLSDLERHAPDEEAPKDWAEAYARLGH